MTAEAGLPTSCCLSVCLSNHLHVYAGDRHTPMGWTSGWMDGWMVIMTNAETDGEKRERQRGQPEPRKEWRPRLRPRPTHHRHIHTLVLAHPLTVCVCDGWMGRISQPARQRDRERKIGDTHPPTHHRFITALCFRPPTPIHPLYARTRKLGRQRRSER